MRPVGDVRVGRSWWRRILDRVRGWLDRVRRPRRPQPESGADGRIRHVFVLVLENRSFDHLLGVSTATVTPDGRLPGRGIDAVTDEMTTVDGPADLTNVDAHGRVFRVRAGAPATMPVDPPHELPDVTRQVSGGMAGFVAAYDDAATAAHSAAGQADPGAVMACLTAEQLPVLSTLAREFAVCDRWFSSVPGPTWPNRFFFHAATSGGLDHSPGALELIGAELAGYRFEHGTLFDRLDAAGRDWRVYHGDPLPQVSSLAGMDLPTVLTRFREVEHLAGDLADPGFEPSYVFIEPDYGNVLGPGGQFTGGSSQHPIDGVAGGEALVKQVYEAIRRSPHWESSVLVITYDEHGGFYDHVPPPAAVPPGDRTEAAHTRHGFGFDRLGVRVPAVVVSPWVPDTRTADDAGRTCNVIDHTGYDHSSVPATVERLFGLAPLTDRDAHAADLRHLLAASRPRQAPWTLPDPAAPVALAAPGSAGPAAPETRESERDDRLVPPEGEPITTGLGAFVELAALQQARIRPLCRPEIAARARAIGTVAGAHRYLTEVAGQFGVADAVQSDVAGRSGAAGESGGTTESTVVVGGAWSRSSGTAGSTPAR